MSEVAKGAVVGFLAGATRRAQKEIVSPGGAVVLTAGLEAGVLQAHNVTSSGEQLGVVETAAAELPLAMALGAWIDKATTGHPAWQRFAKLASLGGLTTAAMYARGDLDGNVFNGVENNPFLGDHQVGVVEAGTFAATALIGNVIGDGMHQQISSAGARPRA